VHRGAKKRMAKLFGLGSVQEHMLVGPLVLVVRVRKKQEKGHNIMVDFYDDGLILRVDPSDDLVHAAPPIGRAEPVLLADVTVRPDCSRFGGRQASNIPRISSSVISHLPPILLAGIFPLLACSWSQRTVGATAPSVSRRIRSATCWSVWARVRCGRTEGAPDAWALMCERNWRSVDVVNFSHA
jgi:hypothetical protein